MKFRRNSTNELFEVDIIPVEEGRYEAILHSTTIADHMNVKQFLRLMDEGEIIPSKDRVKTNKRAKKIFASEEVFNHWLNVFKKPLQTRFTSERRKLIESRLSDGYTVEDLKNAINGVALSDWYVENNRTRIEMILAGGDKTEKFINIFLDKTNECSELSEGEGLASKGIDKIEGGIAVDR